MLLRLLMYLAPLVGILGLYVAGRTQAVVHAEPGGDERIATIHKAGKLSTDVVFNSRLRALVIVAAAVFVALALFLEASTGVAFLFGAGCAMATVYRGTIAATEADVRTCEAARGTGEARAMRIAFEGGAVTGLSAASLALVGIGALYWFCGDPSGASVLAGFMLGSSAVALLVPATATDLLESYSGAIIATVLIAAAMSKLALVTIGTGLVEVETLQSQLMMYPLVMGVLGLLASLAGIYAFDRVDGRGSRTALRYSVSIAGGMFLLAAASVTTMTDISRVVWWALAAGSVGGMAIGIVGQFNASSPAPALQVPGSVGAGLLGEMAAVIENPALPVLAIICACIFICGEAAGIYGVGIGAVGMLATLAATLTIDAYGSIAGEAGRLSDKADLDAHVGGVIEGLKAAGAAATAGRKGFAAAASTLTAVSLFLAYALAINVVRARQGHDAMEIAVTDPRVVIGLFIGGVTSFLLASLCRRAVQHATVADPGASASPEVRERITLTVVAIAGPVLLGALVGPEAVGGMLAGATVCGTLLSLSAAPLVAATSIDQVEMETTGPARLAVAADVTGDAFRRNDVPSINVLVKVMSIVSLVLAPLLA